jgi:hypothetical protein
MMRSSEALRKRKALHVVKCTDHYVIKHGRFPGDTVLSRTYQGIRSGGRSAWSSSMWWATWRKAAKEYGYL